jgi:hypothetical protein
VLETPTAVQDAPPPRKHHSLVEDAMKTLRYRTYKEFNREFRRLLARVVHWYTTDHHYVLVIRNLEVPR